MRCEIPRGWVTARLSLLLGLSIASALWPAASSFAAGRGEPGTLSAVRVELRSPQADLELFRSLDLDVDGVFDGWARVYLLDDEAETLRSLGYELSVLWREPVQKPLASAGAAPWTGEGFTTIPASYHTYETLTAELQAIAAAHLDLVRLFSIGQSVQGRELWMMKITDNPDVEEDEPGMSYVAAMHGDEVVGKEILVGLIHFLLDGYGTDARVTDLVNESEIWIMPSMNPDGTELGTRYNADFYDLNRSFPDWYHDPVNTPDGRPPEVQAMMAWTEANHISLSANMHGGAAWVVYPRGNNANHGNFLTPTPDPDHSAFYSVSLRYASPNPRMSGGESDGVINGAEWYPVTGGIMDWAYAYYGEFQVVPELAYEKWPPASWLPDLWVENLESMLAYFERGHDGLRGLVADADTGAPVAAEIYLDDNPFPVYTDPEVGDYHRVVLPGYYIMRIEAEGYIPSTMPVSVSPGSATRYDVQMLPMTTYLQPVSTRIFDGTFFRYWLTPGEGVDISVTLGNEGSDATGVSGRLISTGWDVEILHADASYPDIPNQGSASSYAPPYEIYLDANTPPGRKIGFAVDWSADQGSGLSEPFYLDVGAQSCQNGSAIDVPQPILDFEITTSEITIVESLSLEDIEVSVDITHPRNGQLTLILYSPSGTAIALHQTNAGFLQNIVGTYGVDLIPADPFWPLTGEDALGVWTLEVHDQGAAATGTLNSWSVEICGRGPTALPAMKFRDLRADQDGVLLNWWPYPGLDSYRVYRATDPSSPASFLDVTGEDDDDTDTSFLDTTALPQAFYLITGVGPQGEGP